MIINIRGTSGTGKSTLVRDLMGLYGTRIPYYYDGRRQPIGYRLVHPIAAFGRHPRGGPADEGSCRPLTVVGHYETDCGGCDTINSQDLIFDLVRQYHSEGFDVVFEGLLISAEVNNTAALHQDGMPLKVFAIELPIEECLRRVNERRRAKAKRVGKEYKGDVNPRNTVAKERGVINSMRRLEDLGVDTQFATGVKIMGRMRALLQV